MIASRWAVLFIGLAGVIHLIVVPEHWGHAPAHGLFFAFAGVAQIVWSVAAWRWPSIRLYQLGMVGAGVLVVLWAITRFAPAPFGHGPEAVDGFGVLCKISEGLGAVVLAVLVFQGMASQAGRPAAWRLTTLLVVAALAGGLLTYGVARAAEPLAPWLGAPAETHDHHDHEH